MKSIHFLVVVISSAIWTNFGNANDPPNILLILADDVGVETLGCYGGDSYETPRLDALSEQGVRFDHCYSMAVCHPTRITLLTGRYPFRWNNPSWGSFPETGERKTFAHQLRSLGYRTAVAGKWQLTLLKNDLKHPHRLGFDHYALFGWHEGPRYFDPMIYQDGELLEGLEGSYGPDVYTDFLIDFMSSSNDQPFCAFYSMALCHDVTDDLREPVPYGPNGRYEDYGEMIEQMDRQVGKLLDALDQHELDDNTVVIFTGDNGTPTRMILTAENGKYQRVPVSSMRNGVDVPGGKGKLTDGGTHVPLIVRWPRNVSTGSTTDCLVDMSDFFPTMVAIAGGEPDEDLDGQSFAAALDDPEASPRSWVYAEHKDRRWVRNQRWKRYESGELFDIEADPLERTPLKRDEASEEALKAISDFERVFGVDLKRD